VIIYVKDETAETITLSADDANGKVGTSGNIVINPASIDYYAVSAATPQAAGEGFTGTVEAYDEYDNFVLTDSSTIITMTNTGSADFYTSATYGTATDTYVLSGGAAVVYVKDDVAETITISARDTNVKVGTSADVVILPNVIDYYSVSATTPQTAGDGFTGTLTAYDVHDNLVYTDSTTVITMTNTGSALFYEDGTYSATTSTYTLGAGVSVIYVQDDISETITISAQDENAKVGTVDYFVVSVVSPQTAGAGFTGTVAGYDQFNNLVAGDSTTAVTLTDTGSADFYTTASYGTGTTETYTLTSGEATIYVRDFVAETIQITAESDNGSIGTSADIWVRPAVINYYAVSASTPQTAGVGFTGTVEAYDVYNNLVFTDSSTVMTMTNTGAAAFYTSGSYAVTTETYMLSSGTAVLFVKDNTAETIQITAESDNGSIGTSANVVIGTNVIDYFTISAGTAQVAGVGFPGTVEAYDAYDNFVASGVIRHANGQLYAFGRRDGHLCQGRDG